MPTIPTRTRPDLAASLRRGTGGPDHIVINAGAGTGKTSTCIQGMIAWEGGETKWPPSDEQAQIWKAMASGPVPRYLTMCAFNKSIATEAGQDLPSRKGWMARTISSAGWGTCRYHLKGIELNDHKTLDLIAVQTGQNLRKLAKQKPGFASAVNRLTRLCKQNLLDGSPDELDYLIVRHGIEIETDQVDDVIDLVPRVLQASLERVVEADFADQLWLPVKLGLRPFRVNLMIVDEAQDLNRCQQEYALMAAERIMLVGDVNQAIYGWAGADTDSIPRMRDLLEATGRGVIDLPLMTTRRCGKEIVRLAQRLVPDYHAHESNPEGSVDRIEQKRWTSQVGDLVICRVNAPTVKVAYTNFRRKVPTQIVGRDFGESLIEMVDRFSGEEDTKGAGEVLRAAEDWRAEEVEKLSQSRYPTEAAIEALNDKVACLKAMTDGGAKQAGEMKAAVNALLSPKDPKECVRVSSIHRAKGLESDRVSILRPDLLPFPMSKQDWELEQEKNLEYVAITRARQALTFVDPPKRRR